MKRAALVCALLALAACQQDPPHQGARPNGAPILEANGYGPLHIGMSLDEARNTTGQPLLADAIESEEACVEVPFNTPDGDTIYAMFEHHRLTRLTANNQAPHTRTAQNVGAGSTDAEVRAAYTNLNQQPAKYRDPPAHDFIVWTEPNKAGFRFEVAADGQVTAVHAGGPSILYVEGCA